MSDHDRDDDEQLEQDIIALMRRMAQPRDPALVPETFEPEEHGVVTVYTSHTVH